MSLSPEEIHQPWRVQMAKLIDSGETADLKEYLSHARSVTFCFELIEQEGDRLTRAMWLREDFARKFILFARTPYQRLMSVIGFIFKMESQGGKQTSKSIADAYGKVEIPEDREQVSDGYVKGAVDLSVNRL